MNNWHNPIIPALNMGKIKMKHDMYDLNAAIYRS